MGGMGDCRRHEAWCRAWLAPVFTVVLLTGLLWPPRAMPGEAVGWLPEAFDALHFPALWVTGWLWAAWRPREAGGALPTGRLLLAGAVLAPMLEPLQLLTGRHADWSDALANLSGWVLGVATGRAATWGRRLWLVAGSALVVGWFAWPLADHWRDRRQVLARLPELPGPDHGAGAGRWWQAYGEDDAGRVSGWRLVAGADGGSALRVDAVGGDYAGVRLRLAGLPEEVRRGWRGVSFEVRAGGPAELTLRVDATAGGDPEGSARRRDYLRVAMDESWREVVWELPPGWGGRAGLEQLAWFRGPGEPPLWFELRGLRLLAVDEGGWGGADGEYP